MITTFTCRPEHFGIIAPPVPARSILPDWYRKLQPVDPVDPCGLTLKRCMPVLDAFTLGWIVPVPVTLTLEVLDGGANVSSADSGVVNHQPYQVAGHHHQPRMAAKFLNLWTIRTEPGWSCLFLPPLNRGSPFECMAAVVDTDTFRAKPVNFPFFWTGPDGEHTIVGGTPMVQVIPFLRDVRPLADIRPSTPDEDKLDLQQQVLFDEPVEGYRRFVRAEKGH